MKFIRYITALGIFLSMVLNMAPDSLLDLFHHHEHAHHCGPVEGVVLEKEHIHCHIPHFFFEDDEQLPRQLKAHTTYFKVFYPEASRSLVLPDICSTPGRGPPSAWKTTLAV